MQEEKRTTQQQQNGTGRSSPVGAEPRNQKEEQNKLGKNDISNMDQYEGKMDHGVLGGNFHNQDIEVKQT